MLSVECRTWSVGCNMESGSVECQLKSSELVVCILKWGFEVWGVNCKSTVWSVKCKVESGKCGV